MDHLREGVFHVIESESDDCQSPSSSPYATAIAFTDALIQELRTSPSLTEQLSELIVIGVHYHRAEMLELPDDAHVLLNRVQSWLDQPYTDARTRRRVIYFLIKLIGSAKAYPSALYLSDIELPPDRAFNGGGRSLVYKGTRKQGSHIQVIALKQPVTEGKRDAVQEAILKDFVREAIVWRQLSHPHIHPLLGLYKGLDRGVFTTYAVSPYCSQTLDEFIEGKSRGMVDIQQYDPEHDCARLLEEIAAGLAYLHSLKIVHCDVKPANVLIAAEKHAHILDFGSNMIGETTPGKLTTPDISTTISWQAPEGFVGNTLRRPSPSYDVYSFACVCYCTSMGYPNIFNYRGSDIISYYVLHVNSGKRPTWEDAMYLPVQPGKALRPSEGLWNKIITPGWSQDPLARPSMAEILDRFVSERQTQ